MTGNRTRTFLMCLLMALAALLAYSNTFNVPFQYDDILLIERNPLVHSLDLVLDPSYAGQFPDYGLARRRIAAFASFALNYRLHKLDVTGYHAVNFSVHLINTLLVFWLVRLLLRTPRVSRDVTDPQHFLLPLSAALVFAVHPVQTEAVTYIYQRIASLVTVFYLAAVIFYLKFRLVPEQMRNRAATRAVYYVLALAFIALGVSTKENALTLPVVIAVMEILLFSGPMKKRLFWALLMFAPLTLYIVSLTQTGLSIKGILFGTGSQADSIVGRSSFDSDYLNPGERRHEYLATQLRVLITYFRLLLLPVNQSFHYDYPVYTSLSAPQVLLSLLCHGAVLGMAAMAYVRSRMGASQWALVTVGILWFYITISLESSIIPLPLMICEYRLYLPGIGIFIAALPAITVPVSRHGSGKQRAAIVLALAAAVLILGIAAHERNSIWESQVSLWSDAAQKSPGDEKGYINTGSAYLLRGDMPNALRMYERAYMLNPAHPNTNYNLGVIYRSIGDVPRAIEHYRLALKAKPNYTSAMFNLGNAYMSMDIVDLAIEQYEQALAVNPYLVDAHMNLSVAYRKKGDVRKALEHADIAQQIRNRTK